MARAGDRRTQVLVQARVTDKDALGAEIAVWKTLFPTVVGITALSGRELLAAQAMRAEISHQIQGTYRSEWSNPTRAASYRIVKGERIFNIHSVQNVDERNRDVLILASEGMNDG